LCHTHVSQHTAVGRPHVIKQCIGLSGNSSDMIECSYTRQAICCYIQIWSADKLSVLEGTARPDICCVISATDGPDMEILPNPALSIESGNAKRSLVRVHVYHKLYNRGIVLRFSVEARDSYSLQKCPKDDLGSTQPSSEWVLPAGKTRWRDAYQLFPSSSLPHAPSRRAQGEGGGRL
jgi:hypothetical protein